MRINFYFSKGKYDQSKSPTGSSIKPPKDTWGVFFVGNKTVWAFMFVLATVLEFPPLCCTIRKSIYIFFLTSHTRPAKWLVVQKWLIYITVRFSLFIAWAQFGDPGIRLWRPNSLWWRSEQPSMTIEWLHIRLKLKGLSRGVSRKSRNLMQNRPAI